MAMTGERVSATQAADWGLVAETAAATDFGTRSAEILSSLATASTPALAETAAAINTNAMDLDAALRRESTGQAALLEGEDFPEGVAAFLEKRSPRFRRHPTRD